jgi:hypothetical protein
LRNVKKQCKVSYIVAEVARNELGMFVSLVVTVEKLAIVSSKADIPVLSRLRSYRKARRNWNILEEKDQKNIPVYQISSQKSKTRMTEGSSKGNLDNVVNP